MLEPLPLVRDLASRSYRNTVSGRLYPVSCTTIIGAVTLTEADRANIERYREVWEPRGLGVHAALEGWLKTGIRPTDDEMGDYRDWILPLIDSPVWQRFEVVGIELPLADDKQNWGGTCDLCVRYPDDTYGIWDLKTKSRRGASKQDVRPQLGAYGRAVGDHYRKLVTRNGVLWSYPGSCTPETFDNDSCHVAWLDVFERYCLTHRVF